MEGGFDYTVMKGHVKEESILSNTAVKSSKLTVLNHQFTFPLERTYW
jgi:hypothetical protein